MTRLQVELQEVACCPAALLELALQALEQRLVLPVPLGLLELLELALLLVQRLGQLALPVVVAFRQGRRPLELHPLVRQPSC